MATFRPTSGHTDRSLVIVRHLTFRNVDCIVGFRSLGGSGRGGCARADHFLVAAISHRLAAKHVGHFVHHTTLDDATHVAVA